MKQTDRIKAIFEDRGDKINFTPVERTIHEGFVDNTLRLCIFTDHQLFDRFHKYNLKSDKAVREKWHYPLKELNQSLRETMWCIRIMVSDVFPAWYVFRMVTLRKRF